MNEYEITYLSETHLGEEARTELDNTVDTQITNLGGSITHSTPSLRMKLAYPINKQNAAFTRTLHIELDSEKIDELYKFFKKNKDIIRVTTIATPYRPGVKQEDDSKPTEKKEETSKDKKKADKPAKQVTMEEVEKGIEDALEEKVK